MKEDSIFARVYEKINPEKFYTLNEIVTNGFFPWTTSIYGARKFVIEDSETNNILKPLFKGEGVAKRYTFLGKNIVEFLKAIEAGKTSYQIISRK